MRLKSLVGGLLVVAAVPSVANEAIRLRVTPEMTVEPAWITVQASIEPDANNRALHLEIDSETFFRSSRVELEGENAPRTNVFQYRGLPAGEYEVRGALIGRDGRQRAIVRRSVMVLP
jgi:hypothetical protein